MSSRVGKASSRGTRSEPSVSLQALLEFPLGIGGAVIAAVELSVDGGTNWHPAIGRTSWSYEWTPDRAGTVSILSRAVDDSGNLGDSGEAVTVRVAAGD